jgi:hypothetical protein
LLAVWWPSFNAATATDEDLQAMYDRAHTAMLRAQAQRDTIAATIAQATRQAIATRQSVAATLTSDARALAKAERETIATATAAYIQAQQTMDAANAQATAQAVNAQATATAITLHQQSVIAQQTSVAAQRQSELEAAAMLTTKANHELRATILNYVVTFGAVLALFIGAYGAYQFIATLNHRRRVMETRAGTIALVNPSGQFTPYLLNAGELVDWSAPSDAAQAAAVEDIRALVPMSNEDRLRADALKLLRHSIQAIGDGAKLATWRELAADGWTARQWSQIVKVLATCGLVETTNRGTVIKQGTARRLYDAIGSKAVSLSPTPSDEGV